MVWIHHVLHALQEFLQRHVRDELLVVVVLAELEMQVDRNATVAFGLHPA